MKVRLFFRLITVALALLLLSGVVLDGPADAAGKSLRKVPKGRSFYDAPDPLPAGKHGDVIWAQEITTSVPGARAWKVLYRSTDIHNTAVPVSGMVIAPRGKAPAGGRPIVSYAHGTAGIAPRCAITQVDNPAKDATFYSFADSPDPIDAGVPGLTRMIAMGYVVVATDYQGLGTRGFHQYLVGPTAARNVLDAIIAARQIPQTGAGKQAVIFGWSQGGQAAIWAGQIADYIEPSTRVLGTAALAPVNALEQSAIEARILASGKKLTTMMGAETTMAQYAMTMTFPELKLSDVMTPLGLDYVREAAKHQCNKQMGQSLDYIQAWKGSTTRPDPQNQDAWLKRTEQVALGMVPVLVPVAVYQGDDDPIIFPEATDAYVKKACAKGATVSYTRYGGTDHLRVPGRAQDDLLEWIADRFAGKSAPSSCK